MVSRQPSTEPSLMVALWWLFLATCGLIAFLGGINFLVALFTSDNEPLPAPTVTVTETQTADLNPSDESTGSVTDEGLSNLPTPSACMKADAQGVIPRDRWTPCGQLLGYFDDKTPLP
ncbi:hypothetical protein [Streptomyces sp. NPDC058434]|uniref:hypothetical protein n=1 Tax=Streptomyces sp. NPDC058434 TaxID=3346498 RepID=UPI0036504F0A